MGRGGKQRREPRVIYRSSFSENPGTEEELDSILLRWELALARKVVRELRSERAAAAKLSERPGGM